jgi:nucleotide-binding universal stress UspA family protein
MSASFQARFRALIVWILVIALFSLTLTPQNAPAALLPSAALMDFEGPGPDRETSLNKIQAVLESKLITQRLTDLGLTETEILSRLGQLSDAQIHQIAARLDAQLPGGGVLGTVVVLLVIAILVVILLQVSGHKVIIIK